MGITLTDYQLRYRLTAFMLLFLNIFSYFLLKNCSKYNKKHLGLHFTTSVSLKQILTKTTRNNDYFLWL
jgi:hypothetical protein